MKYNLVQEKSFAFAIKVVELVKLLKKEHESEISKQLIKSGTSVGANIEEAIGAESRKDFHHKIQIALKEARETRFWLRILSATNPKITQSLTQLITDNEALIRILSKITKTLNQETPTP